MNKKSRMICILGGLSVFTICSVLVTFSLENEKSIDNSASMTQEPEIYLASIGDTYELIYNVTPEAHTEETIWTCSHPNYVEITPNGDKCSIQRIEDYRGYVTITASVGTFSSVCKVFTKDEQIVSSFEFERTNLPQYKNMYYVSDEQINTCYMKFTVMINTTLLQTLNCAIEGEDNFLPSSTADNIYSYVDNLLPSFFTISDDSLEMYDGCYVESMNLMSLIVTCSFNDYSTNCSIYTTYENIGFIVFTNVKTASLITTSITL